MGVTVGTRFGEDALEMDGNEVGRTLARVTRALEAAPWIGSVASSLVASLTGEITVQPARTRREVERFCRWSAALYDGDPNYVQPITRQFADSLTPVSYTHLTLPTILRV